MHTTFPRLRYTLGVSPHARFHDLRGKGYFIRSLASKPRSTPQPYVPKHVQQMHFPNTRGTESAERQTRAQWPHWTRYLTYGSALIYGSLSLIWLENKERVPITERWQFQFLRVDKLFDKGDDQDLTVGESPAGHRYLAIDQTLMERTQSCLDRILLAGGLERYKWKLIIIGDPRKSALKSGSNHGHYNSSSFPY